MGNKIEYVYMLLEETDGWGVWTNPIDAIKWYFRLENGMIEHKGNKYTPDQMVEIMLDPDNDYPILEKIKVNPQKDPWTIDL